MNQIVRANKDQYDENRSLGVSHINFKVSSQENQNILIIENTFHAKGGPAKHLHYNQDEWFYIVEGEFIFELGQENMSLHPGDSLFAPRQIPHVWAYVGEGQGKILITFTPPGKMEAFFREVTKANAMPPQDPALWQAHDMKLVGPPLAVI
jgi:quercetin dioxygenase-like cupin family protein